MLFKKVLTERSKKDIIRRVETKKKVLLLNTHCSMYLCMLYNASCWRFVTVITADSAHHLNSKTALLCLTK